MAVTRDQAVLAGREVADLIALIVDKTPNRQQLQEFFAEGFQAVNAVASVAIPSGGQRAAVISHIAEGILSRLNESVAALKLP